MNELTEWAQAYDSDAAFERDALLLVTEAIVTMPSEYGDVVLSITGPGKVQILSQN